MEMNRTLAKIISADAEKTLQEVAKKHGLSVHSTGGTIDSFAGKFTAKFSFTTPISNTISATITDQQIKFGLAPRGTVVILKDKKEATILETRRSKYLIEMDGKQYTIKFAGCTLKQ